MPMLMTLKGKDKKDALEMFKLVQMYMGDRQTKFKVTHISSHFIT